MNLHQKAQGNSEAVHRKTIAWTIYKSYQTLLMLTKRHVGDSAKMWLWSDDSKLSGLGTKHNIYFAETQH